MHVLVDAAILKPGLGGIATYAEGITRALAQLPDVRLTVLTSRPDRFAGLARVEVMTLDPTVQGFGRRLLWRERRLRKIAADRGADVLLAIAPELPLRGAGIPSVVVVHDVGPLSEPAFHGRARRARFALLLGPMLRRATRIACVSEATRAALAAVRPGLHATVVREGPRTAAAQAWEPASPPYVLYVGPLLAHKNVATLVAALGQPALRGVALRIAGAASAADLRELHARAAAIGAAVEHLGFVTDDELARLYAGARVVALPSLQEGFGLPLLEALVAGAPVVASAIAAHREVGGDGALFVDAAADPAAWAATLDAVIAGAAWTEDHARAGRERVAHYSWQGAAADIHAELLAALAD